MKTTFTQVCSFLRRPGALVALIAGVMLLGVAAPAFAGGGLKNPSVIISSHGAVEFGHGWRDRDRGRDDDHWRGRDKDRGYDQCEYDRGYARGQERGFEAGFNDGLAGRCYDNRSIASFCGVSETFRRGYLDAFTCAYKEGFEKGRRERESCHRPRFRPRCD